MHIIKLLRIFTWPII